MLAKIAGVCVFATLIAHSPIAAAQPQQPTLQERVAGLKAALVSSQANLRQYQWIETTVVSVNGEEKSRKQQRCYYGADGALQKVLVDASPPPATKPGLRGRIIANKTAELTQYMQQAVGLVKSYVPPDPARLQAVKDAGKVGIQVLDPGKRAELDFHDYLLAGDNLAVTIDITNNIIAGLGVSTYLDNPADVVTLNASMGQLNDGTTYTANVTLNAAAKNLTVTVQNSGYQKTN